MNRVAGLLGNRDTESMELNRQPRRPIGQRENDEAIIGRAAATTKNFGNRLPARDPARLLKRLIFGVRFTHFFPVLVFVFVLVSPAVLYRVPLSLSTSTATAEYEYRHAEPLERQFFSRSHGIEVGELLQQLLRRFIDRFWHDDLNQHEHVTRTRPIGDALSFEP